MEEECITSLEAMLISPKDRISALPDDLRIAIVSFLTMNEGAATSLLSKRWKNLWKFYTSCFDFDRFKFVKNHKQQRFPDDGAGAGVQRYISWVNQVLHSHQRPTLQRLRIYMELDSTSIDEWITFAIVKRVQWLELNFDSRNLNRNLNLISHSPELVELASFGLPFRSFDSLSVLCLTGFRISDHTLTDILCNCASLENLSLIRVNTLVKVEIVGHALKLKHVALLFCNDINVVEISSLNLVSFKYWGKRNDVNLNVRNAPLLKEVFIGGGFLKSFIDPAENLLSFLCCLETLVLDVEMMIYPHCLDFFESFPQLAKLRHLEVQVAASESNFCCLIPLIYAFQSLSSFTLKVHYAPPARRQRSGRVPSCDWGKRPHESLRVVKYIGGLDGKENDLDLIIYLVENAVKLEKVIIDPHCAFNWDLEQVFRTEEFDCLDVKRIPVARARAKEVLGTKLCNGAELVIR